MAITQNDIIFVYSAGLHNYNPNKSLGGNPSSVTIGDIGNNLFPSLDSPALSKGIVDYRCFYVFNQSEFDTFYLPKLYVINQSECLCNIGMNLSNEIQKISISGTPTGGTLVFGFDIYTFSITFTTVVAQLEADFKSAFETLGYTVDVNVIHYSCYYGITIAFVGPDGYKYQPLIELISNNLTPSAEIFIARESAGSPINTIAEEIPDMVTSPQTVEFGSYTQGNPIILTSLKPLEGVPVWLQRIVPAGEKNSLNQEFTFVIRGKACL